MRISRSLSVLAFSLALAVSTVFFAPVNAQDTKTDAEAPANVVPQLGPRVKPAGQKPTQPKVENISKHGLWQVQCTELPAEAGGKSCGMIQNTRSEKNEKIGLTVIVTKVKNGDKSVVFMRLLAPVGVYLPTGIPVEIDGTALGNRMVFTRCIPPVCEAAGEASPESLAKFKKGTAATFFLYDRPGNGFGMKISLEGFGAGLAALDQL